MAKFRVRVRNAGLQEIKRSTAAKQAVLEAAERVAASVRAENIRVGDQDGGPDEVPLPVIVREDETVNGARAHVVLAHPAGIAVQAKHGSLTKAAAQAGLKVTDGGGS